MLQPGIPQGSSRKMESFTTNFRHGKLLLLKFLTCTAILNTVLKNKYACLLHGMCPLLTKECSRYVFVSLRGMPEEKKTSLRWKTSTNLASMRELKSALDVQRESFPNPLTVSGIDWIWKEEVHVQSSCLPASSLDVCKTAILLYRVTGDVIPFSWAKCNSQSTSWGNLMGSQAKAPQFLQYARTEGHHSFSDTHCKKRERSEWPYHQMLTCTFYASLLT